MNTSRNSLARPRCARSPRSARPTVRVPAAAAVLAAVALLAGCGAAATESERGSDTFGPVSRVEVKADSGTIQLRNGPDGEARVDRELRWAGDKPQVTQEVRGDVLNVVATCPGDDECNTELILTVPVATSVRADLGAGNVAVTGLSGAQDLNTGAGNVAGIGLGAAPVVAKSSAGNVDLGFAAAPPTADAESSAGNVTIRLPIGPVYETNATTTAGNSRVEVPDQPGAESRITARSSAGNVSILPG